MSLVHVTRTQAERADQTRARILAAAVSHFSEEGLAGARMEQIAEAAEVTKALLYYYFRSKEELYSAALESVAEGVRASSMAILASAGERFLMATLNHFDRIHTNRGFQSLMQQEMIRLHHGEANAMSPLVEKIFRPLMCRLQQVLEEGIASGELIDTDPTQIRYAAMGANVFYFLSAPLIQMIEGGNLLDWRALSFRRSSAIRYLGLTIFTYRRHGESVAERVLDATPMPDNGEISLHLPLQHSPKNSVKKRSKVRHK